MMTDPIADMLTRIRNAQASKRRSLEVPFSKVKFQIAGILKKEGYIGEAIRSIETPRVFTIELKYTGKRSAIQTIERQSKPGHRMYRKAEEIPNILNGYGMAVVSTSQGLMTGKEAKKKGIGGEIICSVY